MKKRSKKYQEALAKIDANKVYTIEEAAKLVKETKTVKFDATVDISFRLNVDPKQADQLVRGTLVLPHGNGKTKKVLAITDKADEALAAGADFAGGAEMIDKIQKENWFEYDVIVATPNMMGLLGKIARTLGPKGLMPNPKAGTVSPDIAKAVKEIKAGKVQYRVEKIVDNLNAICEAVVKARPASCKGNYIKTAAIHTTMGPSINITFNGR